MENDVLSTKVSFCHSQSLTNIIRALNSLYHARAGDISTSTPFETESNIISIFSQNSYPCWMATKKEAKIRLCISKTEINLFLEDDIYRKCLHSTSVMEMQLVEIPEFEILCGEEAIEALYVFINELEGQRGKELTDKQTNALIKLAKGLIASIETETRLEASSEETDLLRHLKKTTVKRISDARTRFSSFFAR